VAWKQQESALQPISVPPDSSKVPVLAVTKLRIARERKVILRRLDWQVQQGQHWVILGPNGSGKSSLLAALTGYFAPTSGNVSVLGETFGRSDWRELRLRIGLVGPAVAALIQPSEPALHIVAGGVAGVINLWRRPKPAAISIASKLLRQLKASGVALRPWGHLSQGERQRVLIARALASAPTLLILDEPCAGLDPLARRDFLTLLNELPRRLPGVSVVLVTHHVEEIAPAFTHALLLRNGQKVAAGPLREVLTSRQLTALWGKKVRLNQHRLGWSMGWA
jgi:iron complex transport system ATP-binding protein